MFDYTYEELLERALNRVGSGMDTSQGSFLYDSISCMTQELYQCYLYFNELEKRVYADTSYQEYLEQRCAERGISRDKAICSERIIVFDLEGITVDTLVGTVWGIEDVTYTVISTYDSNKCIAKCDVAGAIGNRYSGAMININAVANVNSANLDVIVVAGDDDETDDSLRHRYFESFNKMSFGGNIADYKEKVGDIEGVGQVKVYPVWNGDGTVLIRILGNDSTIPSKVLLDKVQEEVDPLSATSKGYGIAPIGHTVTVLGANAVDVNIEVTLQYKVGYSAANVTDKVKEVIEEYIEKLRDDWSDTDNIIIRIAQIEARILDVEGILDVTGTSINGSTVNITLNDDEIPVLNEVIIS